MNPEPESTTISQTGEAPDNSTRSLDTSRSRELTFLEEFKAPASQGEDARSGQRAFNFALYCALVVAVLTVFGIGLSRVGGGSQKGKDDHISQSANQPVSQSASQSATPLAPQSANKSAGAEASTGLAPTLAQPAGPAGHAEVRLQSEPGKKTDSK